MGDPAAMAGVDGVPQFDQRGAPFTRVHGGRIDIGAFESQPNPLPGDYNFSGVVDAADVVVWRKTINSTTDLRADGNGDGIVNQDDWQVWRANFGRTAESGEQGAKSQERGAESTESAANQVPTPRPAWQPPVNDRRGGLRRGFLRRRRGQCFGRRPSDLSRRKICSRRSLQRVRWIATDMILHQRDCNRCAKASPIQTRSALTPLITCSNL